jgi:HEAT repeat protein
MHSVAGTGEAVAPVLLKVFRQGDAGVRQSVMQVCWRYGVKTKDLVVEGLKDKNGSVRQQALYALQNMQVDRAEMIPTLVTLLRDKDSDVNVRVQVSHILRNLGPKAAKAAPALKEALHDPNPTVRMNVVVILASVGGEGPEFLVKHYQSEKDVNARVSLMQGLVYSGNPKLALPLVKIAMKDPAAQVRQNTVNMLHAFGRDSKEGFEAFALGLKDADAQVRIMAANRGNVFGAKSWGLLEESLKSTKDGNLRQAVLQGLQNTNYRTKSGVPALIDCLKDANPTVRMFACNLLGNMGQDATSALPPLRALTKDAHPSVQQSARIALQRIEAKK